MFVCLRPRSSAGLAVILAVGELCGQRVFQFGSDAATIRECIREKMNGLRHLVRWSARDLQQVVEVYRQVVFGSPPCHWRAHDLFM